MKDDFSLWMRQNAETLKADELSAAFREMQQAHYAAGWRRNMLWLAFALPVIAALAGWCAGG